MQQATFQKIAVGCFLLYCALFPGSTLTVAMNQVPTWGSWMGGALLMLQGITVLCWLISSYGRRGLSAGAAALLLAWSVEHIGETTGWPFGSYRYTELLQPQLFGVVPIPITCAWIMVAIGAWQLAQARTSRASHYRGYYRYTILARHPVVRLLVAATLVVILDLQIETVATRITPYWIWYDGGPYYGVPTINFVAWWVVGLAMALILYGLLNRHQPIALRHPSPLFGQVFKHIPALLYVLSSLMFTVVNMAHGFTWAGVVGFALLALLAVRALSGWNLAFDQPGVPATHQTSD